MLNFFIKHIIYKNKISYTENIIYEEIFLDLYCLHHNFLHISCELEQQISDIILCRTLSSTHQLSKSVFRSTFHASLSIWPFFRYSSNFPRAFLQSSTWRRIYGK